MSTKAKSNGTKNKASKKHGTSAHPGKAGAAKKKHPANHTEVALHPDEQAFIDLRPVIEAVPTDAAVVPRFVVDDAVTATLRLAESAEAHRAAIEALEEASPGTTEALDRLPSLARSMRHINGRYQRTQATEGWAVIPEAMVAEGDELRAKMSAVIAYNLGRDPEVAETLAYVRQGTGHRDRAGDLEELATLYVDHAAVLAKDVVQYVASDAVRARNLAIEMTDLLDRERGGASSEWGELRAKVNGLLLEAHNRITRALLFIDHRAPVETYPSIHTTVRALRMSRGSRRSAEPTPDAAPEVVAPAPSPTNGVPVAPPAP